MFRLSLFVLGCVVFAGAEPRCPAYDTLGFATFFAHESDCTKYYECSNGVAILMTCPSGLEFNARTIGCDYPDSAHCTKAPDGPVPNPPAGPVPNPPVIPTTFQKLLLKPVA